jgi:hypothetical protein
MRDYEQLWKDVVEGLKTRGYEDYGGNDTNFLIMKNKNFPETSIKIFINHYDNNLSYEDINHIIVRFTG